MMYAQGGWMWAALADVSLLGTGITRGLKAHLCTIDVYILYDCGRSEGTLEVVVIRMYV